MRLISTSLFLTTMGLSLVAVSRGVSLRDETSDVEPVHWEGINNRGHQFEPEWVTQDFGYSSRSRDAGVRPGDVGGAIKD